MRRGCERNEISYSGIDYSDCNIEVNSLRYDDEYFDVVTCLSLIEHLREPDNLLMEGYRVLKKSGLIILLTPNWKYCMHDFYDDPTHVRPYTPKSLELAMSLVGFTQVKTVPSLRCKSKNMYEGRWCYQIASMIPFTNKKGLELIPTFLKGKARAFFALGLKQ